MILVILNLVLGCGILLGGSQTDVKEIHQVTEIENGYVHGERVMGSGEGIYYSLNQLKEEGVEDVHVGDKIEFSWSQEDFENENWENFDAKEVK
jgi:hypothetical protein